VGYCRWSILRLRRGGQRRSRRGGLTSSHGFMVDDGVNFCAVQSCWLLGLPRCILYRRRSDSSVALRICICCRWSGCGIDWRRSRGRCPGSLVTSKTVVPLSTLNLDNLARQHVISFLFIPDLSDNALPVSSVQTMNEARDQMRVFRGFFNGGDSRAKLSSLSVLVLIRATASFILEQLQT